MPPNTRDPESAADEAKQALCDLVASFGVAADQHEEMIEELLTGARHQHRADRHVDFLDCAIAHAEERFEFWLATVLEPALPRGHAALAVGRAAYLSCGGPARWPHLLLVHHDLPAAFVDAMRLAVPPLSPMPAPTAMNEQILDSWSLSDSARTARQLLGTTLAQTLSIRPPATASIWLAKR